MYIYIYILYICFSDVLTDFSIIKETTKKKNDLLKAPILSEILHKISYKIFNRNKISSQKVVH